MSKFFEEAFKDIDLRGKIVLEAGCGAGLMTRFLLANDVKRVVAVSNSKDDIEYCKKIILPEYGDRVEFIHGDLRDPDLIEPGSAEIITSSFFFNMLNPFDLESVLSVFEGIIIPGGILAVIDYSPFDSYCDETSSIQRELWNLENALSVILTGEKMYNEYPPEWVETRMEFAGFSIVDSNILVESVNWRPELFFEHRETFLRNLVKIEDEGIRNAFRGRLEDIIVRASSAEVRSGQIYSIVAGVEEGGTHIYLN